MKGISFTFIVDMSSVRVEKLILLLYRANLYRSSRAKITEGELLQRVYRFAQRLMAALISSATVYPCGVAQKTHEVGNPK